MLPRLVLAALASLMLTAPAYALTSAETLLVLSSPCARQLLLTDFARNGGGGFYCENGRRYASFLAMPGASFTRASVGTATWADGHVSTFASGVPRITDQGLLVEEVRTNSIRNSTMQGAVVGDFGSTGSLPTNWGIAGGFAGLTVAIAGIGVQQGLNYIDIRIYGTSTGSFTLGVQSESPTTGPAAANGQTWTGAAALALVGGSISNVSTIIARCRSLDSAGNPLEASASVDIKAALTSKLSPFSSTATWTNPSTAHVVQQILVSGSTGTAIDVTLRIAANQLELGSFATSYIPTTSAAATRAADSATLPWSPGTSGTIIGTHVWGPNAASSARIAGTNGSGQETPLSEVSGSKLASWNGVVNLTTLVVSPLPTVGLTVVKGASTWAPSTRSIAVNGAAAVTDSNVAFTNAVTLLRIGSANGAPFLDSYVLALSISNAAVTAAQLQALTQ